MQISFYITNGNCGLKFNGPAERDAFWNSLRNSTRNNFCAQEAAERVGQKTIRFYPQKMKEGFEWPMNGATEAPKVAAAPVTSVVIKQATEPQLPKTDTVTVNPFEKLANNPTRPLPGLCPPPPASMLADQQPVEPTPAVTVPAAPVVPVEQAATASDQLKAVEALAPVEPAPATETPKDDPEPADKRTKAWRQWNARQQ